ncbi:MAG: hypothetical protein CBB68_08910 [Rhodospirillaceae bacterium TMED8]|nr:hypothetical protein [Magnetovibrio sp.]OUT50480.1 MAG: hypothetical protein CBB68_08910 [Rhodospirillaceae bacterium TMED8]|tara:strand:- start:557 stop:1018 length:462 start_codon:yes stop_codon:yes gene_type:complete
MLDQIKSRLFSPADGKPEKDQIPVAAATLLIESAVLDGDFDANERVIISRLLAERFSLSAVEVAALIEEGERAAENAVELYGITRILKEGLDYDQRLKIMEILWQVVYADGRVHDYEANLARRVAGLLHVPDRESAFARRRALEQLDITGGES